MKSILKYDRDFYDKWVLDNIEPLSNSEMKKEYNRLRKIIGKRLDVLKKYKESPEIRKKYYRLTREPAGKLSKETLKTRLQEFGRFSELKGGSHTELQKIKKQTIETLHEHDYNFVNNKNFESFTKFMELMRSTLIGRMLSSNQIAESFDDFINSGKMYPEELEKKYEEYYYKLLENSDFETSKIPRINSKEFRKFAESLE